MKKLLLLSLAVITIPAAQMPPQKATMASLEGLPTELKNIVLQNIGTGPNGVLNIPALAQGITSLAATSKKWHAVVNNPQNMLVILKSLPRAGAKLLVEQLQAKDKTFPVMKNKEIDAWIKSYELEDGLQLFDAVRVDNADIIAQMLKNPNINVNYKGSDNDTALIAASLRGRMEFVKLLLAAGADVNAKNRYGINALIYASSGDNTEVVRLLLAAGAAVNSKTNYTQSNIIYNETPLMKASSRGRTKNVELLLTAGANVDVKNSSDQTALMLASRAGHVEVVRLLLNSGANVDARSKHTFNMTALEFAQIQCTTHQNSERQKNYNEIITLLEAAEKAQKEKAARK